MTQPNGVSWRIAALIVGLLAVGPVWMITHKFDSRAWKAVDGTYNQSRKRMIDDLMRRSLVGMTRGQIDELLGPPTQTDKFAEYDYVYWLGDDDFLFPVDSKWLCIRFNDGVVVEAVVLTD